MTTEQIDRINTLIAEKVMGWELVCMDWCSNGRTGYTNQYPYYFRSCRTCKVWSPTTNISQAMAAINKLGQPYRIEGDGVDGCVVSVWDSTRQRNARCAGRNASAVICLALLKSIGINTTELE